MELGLQNKNAIITGGSAGIGLEIAKALVGEGVNVIIVGRSAKRLEQAENQLKQRSTQGQQIFSISGDLSKGDQVEQVTSNAFSLFKNIDILINSAGSAPAGSFFDMSDEAFQQAWNLKFLGYVRMVKKIGEQMINQKNGNIINIIGAAGRTPHPTFLPGSTTNAALMNFTKGISKELAPFNVKINAISPGVTATERAEKLASQNAQAKGITLEEQKNEVKSAIPLGSMVDPKEIADLALLLVSDRMSSMTGSEIIIDGGEKPGM